MIEVPGSTQAHFRACAQGELKSAFLIGFLSICRHLHCEYRKFEGLGHDERLMYDLVKAGGNKGILNKCLSDKSFVEMGGVVSGVWSRDLRHKSGLSQKDTNRVLQTLERRKLIKSVNAVVVSQ